MPSCPPGQALEAGRDCRQVVRVLLAKTRRRPHGEAVAGQDGGFLDVDDPGDQVIEQPVKLAGQTHVLPLWWSVPATGSRGLLIVALLATVTAGLWTRRRVERWNRPGNVTAALPASLQGRHRAACGLRGRRVRGAVGHVMGDDAVIAQLRGQAGPAAPDRQAHLD